MKLNVNIPAGYKGFLYPRDLGDPSSIDSEQCWLVLAPSVTAHPAHTTTADNRTSFAAIVPTGLRVWYILAEKHQILVGNARTLVP